MWIIKFLRLVGSSKLILQTLITVLQVLQDKFGDEVPVSDAETTAKIEKAKQLIKVVGRRTGTDTGSLV